MAILSVCIFMGLLLVAQAIRSLKDIKIDIKHNKVMLYKEASNEN